MPQLSNLHLGVRYDRLLAFANTQIGSDNFVRLVAPFVPPKATRSHSKSAAGIGREFGRFTTADDFSITIAGEGVSVVTATALQTAVRGALRLIASCRYDTALQRGEGGPWHDVLGHQPARIIVRRRTVSPGRIQWSLDQVLAFRATREIPFADDLLNYWYLQVCKLVVALRNEDEIVLLTRVDGGFVKKRFQRRELARCSAPNCSRFFFRANVRRQTCSEACRLRRWRSGRERTAPSETL